MIANDVQQLINNKLPVDRSTKIELETHIYSVVSDDIDTNKIVILITDLPNKPYMYGSNQMYMKDNRISIKIYYPENYPEDYDLVSDDITEILESDGWYFITNNIMTDPDTMKSYMQLDFHKYYKRRKKEF